MGLLGQWRLQQAYRATFVHTGKGWSENMAVNLLGSGSRISSWSGCCIELLYLSVLFQEQKRILEMGITGPEGHALSRPEEVRGFAHLVHGKTLSSMQYCSLASVHADDRWVHGGRQHPVCPMATSRIILFLSVSEPCALTPGFDDCIAGWAPTVLLMG